MIILVGSAVFDIACAWFVLWLASRQADGSTRVGLWEMFAAALVCGLVFGMKLPALMFAGVNVFGAMCVAYVTLVIALPLAAWLVLGQERLGRWRGAAGALRLSSPARVLVLAVAIGGPAVGVYATLFETGNTRLEEAVVVVPAARAGSATIRIGVLADIQTNAVTEHERDAVAQLLAMEPDVILLPGDLFQGFPQQFRAAHRDLRDLLGSLHAPGGVFFVYGDCDQSERTGLLLECTGIRALRNEIVQVQVRDRTLTLAGVELNYLSAAAQATMDDLASRAGDDDVRILLSHRPDAAMSLPANSRVDLVVAGHTHGGQVQLPIVGPLMTLSNVPNDVAAGGLHAIAGNRIYVSRGLGRERGQAPSIRFLCPPEITLLTVRD